MRPELIRSTVGGASAAGGASAVATANTEALLALFEQLESLVGILATQALYRRALHLADASFERTPPEPACPLAEQLARLHHDLSARTPAEAARAAAALRRAFAGLLVSLIGRALTHRLLSSAWGHARAETCLQELTK